VTDRRRGDGSDERALLVAARGGDEQAFERLVGSYRGELHRHCYRLLGSVDDADDALQETLVRAWRGLSGFEPRAPLRAWLYRIATNACLRLMEGRRRQPRTLDADEAAVAGYLQPYPDDLLATLPSGSPGPAAVAEERESLALSVVAAMQLLPARQRVVLVLRDVLGWSARETAELLDTTVAGVNSALQRARERLDGLQRDGALARDHAPATPRSEQAVMARFLAAWEAVDVDAIVALLADDALLTMPPEPTRIVGADAIGVFFRTVPAGGFLDRIRLEQTRANGQPAVVAYLADAEGAYQAYGVIVLALDGESITSITGFAGYPALVPRFGLPPVLPDRARAGSDDAP
jgi:RNA polymerase sigma-70 factor (ECF subfamily)